MVQHIGNFTDINECSTNNGGCEQLCHNTVGSYYCTCNSSYTLNTDDHMCDGKLLSQLYKLIIICRYQ